MTVADHYLNQLLEAVKIVMDRIDNYELGPIRCGREHADEISEEVQRLRDLVPEYDENPIGDRP
jgi:hypothetical protein